MLEASNIEPLAPHPLFRSGDLDQTRALVASKFCDHRLDQTRRDQQLDAVHNHARGAAVSVNYLRYGAEVEIEPGELTHFYLVQVPLRGRARVTNGRQQVDSGPGLATILNPHRHTKMLWEADCEMLLVQIDRAATQARARAMLGRDPGAPLRFALGLDLTSDAGRRWLGLLRAAVAQAEAGRAFAGAGGLSQPLIEDSLLTALLDMQDSSLHPALSSRPRAAGNLYLRRAQAFIHAHLTDPIDASAIATAAGTSLRNLQYGFRAEFGCTPMAYLRRQRLCAARAALRHPAPGTTVAQIAIDAGFTHQSRFAAAYVAAFDEPPSATLRQALG